MKLVDGSRYLYNDWIRMKSVHKYWNEFQWMKLVNDSRCLYKMTELEPNQYMNTEMSPNQ